MKIKIGNFCVSELYQIRDDLKKYKNDNLKDGFSFLIRVKNEKQTIEKCVIDIVDIADEIIVVDNNSTDGTKELLKELEKKYHNVFMYEYNIDVPRAGKEHIDNYKFSDKRKYNTLKNYYNWTLSKATYKKVIKWDGDFYCIKENLIEMLQVVREKMNCDLSVFFSGITMFFNNNKKFLKKNNLYNEYRLFSKEYGFMWQDSFVNVDENICETSWDYIKIKNKENLFIYTKPIYFEIKITSKNEFESRSTLFNDGRDSVDAKILYDLVNDISNEKIYECDDYYCESENFFMNHSGNIIKNNIISEYRNLNNPDEINIVCNK
jgi:glycosyltransferase involved in cell wall biosynthesis